MSSASLESAQPLRLSLLGLPLEIKTEIVRLVRAQDEAFINRNPVREKREPVFDEGSEEDWIGRGTPALFMVNREFNLLAAVQLFTMSLESERGREGEGLELMELRRPAGDSSNQGGTPRLHAPRTRKSSLALRPRRCRLRRQPRVRPGRSHQLLELLRLPAPPSQPLLRRILHGRDGTRRDLPSDRSGRVYAGRLLRGGGACSPSRLLQCRPFPIALRHNYPRMFSNLRQLSVQFLRVGRHSASFVAAIAALPLLEDLDIVRTASVVHESIDWTAPEWQTKSFRPLKLWSGSPYDEIRLLEAFSGTIKSFEFKASAAITSISVAPATLPALGTTFPLLTSITTRCSLPAILPFLSSPAFATSPLRHLELDICHNSTPTLYTASDTLSLLDVVSTWTPNLRYFSVVQTMRNESIMLPSMARAVKAFVLP